MTKLFRIGVIIEEFIEGNFKTTFNMGKACKKKDLLKNLENFNKEVQEFLKENE